MPVKAIPEGYHSVTPYLIINGAADAIEFYKKAFGATEVMRLPMGDKIGHAEIKLGDSHVMLSDEWPEMENFSPVKRGGTSVSLMFYVENPDAVFDRAIKAGATVQKPIENQFYGDRTGTLKDPFGHVWSIGAHVEDVPMDELKKRMESWTKEHEKATA